MQDDVNKLIEQAKIDTTDLSHFDKFLVTNGWDEYDLSMRVMNEDLFLAYSNYYYNEFKIIPHVKTFAAYSIYFRKHKIRQRNQVNRKKLAWGFKCSGTFYDFIKKFKKENTEWYGKLKSIRNGKRSHRARKVNAKESKHLEEILRMHPSKKDSSQK